MRGCYLRGIRFEIDRAEHQNQKFSSQEYNSLIYQVLSFLEVLYGHYW